MEESTTPASDEDKIKWKGFCEIESEPAFFNTMLRRFGVKGIKVQEVVSLDTDMLAFLPRPVFGLIFLFRWTEQDPNKQEQSCPESIWFANQTSNNSCASVALLNIVNNIPDVHLGEPLGAFKHFTKDFSPALRGDAISNFQFVKEIHNSFARKMDMLNADLLLKNEANARSKGKYAEREGDEGDAGFHFIAFMPIEGHLWKFDGLERQPMSLGDYQSSKILSATELINAREGPVVGDWLEQATPEIQARMAQYEENQIEFAILSLVKDPIIDLLSALAENIQGILATQSRLDVIKPDWNLLTSLKPNDNDQYATEKVIMGPDAGLHLTYEQISLAETNKEVAARLRICEPTEMLIIHKGLLSTQRNLRLALQEEIQSQSLEDEKASGRSRDSGAKMQRFARKIRAKEVS